MDAVSALPAAGESFLAAEGRNGLPLLDARKALTIIVRQRRPDEFGAAKDITSLIIPHLC